MSDDETRSELSRETAEAGRESAEDHREEADRERDSAEEHRTVAEAARAKTGAKIRRARTVSIRSSNSGLNGRRCRRRTALGSNPPGDQGDDGEATAPPARTQTQPSAKLAALDQHPGALQRKECCWNPFRRERERSHEIVDCSAEHEPREEAPSRPDPRCARTKQKSMREIPERGVPSPSPEFAETRGRQRLVHHGTCLDAEPSPSTGQQVKQDRPIVSTRTRLCCRHAAEEAATSGRGRASRRRGARHAAIQRRPVLPPPRHCALTGDRRLECSLHAQT